jgi:hypothetical protein
MAGAPTHRLQPALDEIELSTLSDEEKTRIKAYLLDALTPAIDALAISTLKPLPPLLLIDEDYAKELEKTLDQLFLVSPWRSCGCFHASDASTGIHWPPA